MQPAIPPSSHHVADAVTVKGLRGSPISCALGGASSNSSTDVASGMNTSLTNTRAMSPSISGSQNHPGDDLPIEDPPVICKLAERVRLKRVRDFLCHRKY